MTVLQMPIATDVTTDAAHVPTAVDTLDPAGTLLDELAEQQVGERAAELKSIPSLSTLYCITLRVGTDLQVA